MKLSKRKSVFLLGVICFFVCVISILIQGRTYTITFQVSDDVVDADMVKFEIEQEKESVECIQKKLENGTLFLKFRSKDKGKAYIIYESGDGISQLKTLYIHEFGVMTYENFFGDSRGDEIIPISLSIFLSYILYLLILSYMKNKKENLYQYKNISYLGMIIFLSFFLLNQIWSIFHYYGLSKTVDEIISTVTGFSLVVLPIAFVVSILVTISNIKLLKKEGKSLHNLLGVFLGFFFIFLTIFPEILGDYLQRSTVIDVHNLNALPAYLDMFIRTSIYGIVVYLECILIGTIIIGFKSAKHIPNFNKDFIIILGCQIRKDGTLTPLLKSRVDRAMEFRNMQIQNSKKDLMFVPSGGKGEDEAISEGEAMKNYLLSCGIKEDHILVEKQSKNTYENMKFSNQIIKKHKKDAKIAFSTTNYHVFRAGLIAYEQGLKLEGIGNKTKSYFWVNAFIREFIGTLYAEKKKHFTMVLLILIFTVFLIVIIYYSMNI